jgi:AcrR family transcriptional regulator
MDPRTRRTRDRLGDALMELIQEKAFESITVQDVLDRAEVGRSTFYVHYRDKDDLFFSDIDEFFDMMATRLSRHEEDSDRVAPVREMFSHLSEVRAFYKAMVATGRIHEVLELAQGHFSRGIERRLAERPRARGIPAAQRAACAQAQAGALLALMTWWIDHEKHSSPEQMDALFHRMVWTGLDR